jgi:hypothetical protein
MMTPAVLLILLLVGLAVAAGYVLGRSAAQQAARQAAFDVAQVEAVRQENHALRALVADLKDLAWDHRELDSPLATILIDEIRAHERRELGP